MLTVNNSCIVLLIDCRSRTKGTEWNGHCAHHTCGQELSRTGELLDGRCNVVYDPHAKGMTKHYLDHLRQVNYC
jgi:hypothetical protein